MGRASALKRVAKLTPKSAPIKLDVSIGPTPAEGFVRPEGFSPTVFPWPLRAGSVAEASSIYLFQRLPASDRARFMDELARVLVPGGKATFLVPYWTHVRAIQDPSAQWPPIAEQSFLYYNKVWREANAPDYPCSCDFDFAYGYTLDPEVAGRADDVRTGMAKRDLNAVLDLHLVVTKREA